MSRFINVTESRYGNLLLLNIDNIVVVDEIAGVVHTNTQHGEGTGMFTFDKENMQKIINAVLG